MPKLLGLDIDRDRVRISAAESRFGRISFLRSEEFPLPKEPEERKRVLLDQLGQWKAAFEPSGVVLGLPLQNFSCRLINMPVMNREDLGRALQFELEKYLPLPVEDYLHDFTTTKTVSELKTYVLSVKRETVTDLINTVSDAGLKVVSVRCRAVDALVRMLDILRAKELNGIFVLTVDDGYEICHFELSRPVFLRKVGRSNLSDELEKLTEDESLKVYFSGEIDQTTAEHFKGEKLQVQVSDALIFSYLKKGKVSLDFMPPELLPPTKDYYPVLTYGLFAASFLIYVLTGLISYYKDASTLSRIESRIEEIKGQSSAVIEERKKLDDLMEERKSLLEFMAGSNRVSGTLKDLSVTVPADTWIMSLTIDDRNIIEMEGFSRKTSDLIMALEKTGKYKNISFASPIITKDGEERFSLKLEGKEE